MKNNKIQRLLVIFFLINVILFGIYGHLLYSMQTKNKETAALYTASHEEDSDKEKIRELSRVLEDTKKERDNLSEYFVANTNAVTFIEQIEKVGKTAGVELTVLSVSDETKENGVVELGFSAIGGFTHLYHLIAIVESMPYKVVIKKADIQKTMEKTAGQHGGQKEGAVMWAGNFTVTLESFIATNAATETKSLP
jgi:hypothetical protein